MLWLLKSVDWHLMTDILTVWLLSTERLAVMMLPIEERDSEIPEPWASYGKRGIRWSKVDININCNIRTLTGASSQECLYLQIGEIPRIFGFPNNTLKFQENGRCLRLRDFEGYYKPNLASYPSGDYPGSLGWVNTRLKVFYRDYLSTGFVYKNVGKLFLTSRWCIYRFG